MATIAPVLRQALHAAKEEELLSDEVYQLKLHQYNEQFTEETFTRTLKQTIEDRTLVAIDAGLGATTVDAKAAELELLKDMENSIFQAEEMIARNDKPSQADDIRNLFIWLRRLFNVFPKARMAKITRTMIDRISKIPDTDKLQVEICESVIAWCEQENRSFLKHRLQTKLAGLCCRLRKYQAGLALIPTLASEVKKIDDKLLLVEIHLVEAKLNFSVRHIGKAKAALTTAKTNANAIHCPTQLQADCHLTAGCLHAEEEDFKTAYSYFYESFEAFHTLKDPRAITALKYMILCRIMMGASANLASLGKTVAGLELKGTEKDEIECLMEIAKSYQDRSLSKFEQAVNQNREMIEGDPLLSRHIGHAADQLLERAILKTVLPYSEVELTHIAATINLPQTTIERKLAEMILDRKTSGTIDQKRGVFILFDAPPPRKLCEDSAEVLESLREVVNVLSTKVGEMV